MKLKLELEEVAEPPKKVFMKKKFGKPGCPRHGTPDVCQTTMCPEHGEYCFLCGCCDRTERLGDEND